MPNRRQFVTTTAAVLGAASLARSAARTASATTDHERGGPGAGLPANTTDLTKFRDPIRIPPVIKPSASTPEITVRQIATTVRFHSELPPTPVWAYEGSVPGPTIVVRRDQRLRVAWRNEISGPFPVTAIQVPFTDLGSLLDPGRGTATPDPSVAALPAWNVVHLHGAVTGGGNDGWTENGISPGDTQLVEYANAQRSTALWYHDHANCITAFNVYAGLAGQFLIRDAEEDALNLPSGPRELPLVIADRNLDTDAQGVPTGRLLHRIGYVDGGTPEHPTRLNLPFIGPYNVVNGVIWPYVPVDSRWWRFRILNGANTREYTLELRVENPDGTLTPVPGALVQIGGDHGLLPAPVRLDALTLGAAERADVLVDFKDHAGKRLRLVDTNTSGPSPLGPEVLQFRVEKARSAETFTLPSVVSPSFRRLTRADLPADHVERWIALSTDDGQPLGHPEIWELTETPADYQARPGDRLLTVTDAAGTSRSFRRTASVLDDALGFFVAQDSWEVWNFVHIAGPGHPMHVHLLGFQALRRDVYTATASTAPDDVVHWTATHQAPGVLGPEEQGWKDTIRVAPYEVVTIAGQFTGATGRYLYHCHILEHEDEGMMRPFTVTPKQVLTRMGHHSPHHPTAHTHNHQ
ncbi:multicopper oxidase domain-containing protein [Yinghuangia sp. ASG 101]|uniref:multicopper oxidase family protein n=1 Tax=Yinghuangia sp. ASG 101 TaxID=2896848 RepID=UPI001E583BD6|nr:multicopper oxidase domain-containing protein [Yinghuangia sp. ASG 101]UGQ13414.1 multicopper oxidase domain-containing protein [Yinghuangia sp. ASG 101]